MPLTDQYRRRVQQTTEKIAKLQRDKSNLVKKSSELQKKAYSAISAAGRTKSLSTKQSKLRESERANAEIARS